MLRFLRLNRNTGKIPLRVKMKRILAKDRADSARLWLLGKRKAPLAQGPFSENKTRMEEIIT